MALWDRLKKLLGDEASAAPTADAAPAPAPSEPLEELELDPVDLETEDAHVEVLAIEDPDSMDSIDPSARHHLETPELDLGHLDLPEFLAEDEVTELGVDPEKVRARMRRSDPMFPDDEITEVTWLSEITADEEPSADAPEIALPLESLDDSVELALPVEAIDDDETLDEVTGELPRAIGDEDAGDEVTGEVTAVLPEPLVEATVVVEEAVGAEPEATQRVLVEETEEPTGDGDGEVTDFHLDVFDWSESSDEDAPPRVRFANSMRISDDVVAQSLQVEHFPDLKLDVGVLHALAVSDARLLAASLRAGQVLVDVLATLDQRPLVESALLWTSYRSEPAVRAARSGLDDSAESLRRLAWASLYHLPWIVVASEEGCPPELAQASEALLDAYDDRITLLERHGVDHASLDSQPVSPVGLHRLDGFAWSD